MINSSTETKTVSRFDSWPIDPTIVLRGFLMGGADIIPGVSGGTVALILGIYERLVLAISHIDTTFLGHLAKGQFREAFAHIDLKFLASLGTGIAIGIIGLATLLHYLLTYHLQSTLAVFFGLILASCFLVARQIDRWTFVHWFGILEGAGFAYWLVGQPFMKGYEGYPYLFLCGTIAICAMILPGISGAFILLIMGKYYFVTGVLRDLVHGHFSSEHLLVFVTFVAGCATGLLVFSKILRWLLEKYHSLTMAALCGFMLGSLRKIWPFKPIPDGADLDLKHAQLENIWPDPSSATFWICVAWTVGSIVFVLALHRLANTQKS